MKRIVIFLIVLTLLISSLSGCAPSEEEQRAAVDELNSVVYQLINEEKYDDAKNYLLSQEENKLVKDELSHLLLETEKARYNKIASELNSLTGYEDREKQIELVEQLEDIEGFSEFRDMIAYTATIEGTKLRGVLYTTYISYCSEGSKADRLYQAFDVFSKNDFVEGSIKLVNALEDTPEDLLVITDALSLSLRNERKEDLHTALKIAKALAIMSTAECSITGKDNSENYSEIDANVEKDAFNYNYTLSSSEIATLKEECGTSSNGKVLVLHSREEFKKDKELDIHIDFMRTFSEEYLPETLAEVEYIILVESTCTENGEYDKGTIALDVNARMRLYKVGNATPVYSTNTITERAPSLFISGEDVPEYKYAYSPDATEQIVEILNVLNGLVG